MNELRKATKLAGFALLFLITSSLLFPLTINFSLAEAGTTVSVQITSDTVWTKANSPYIFTEGVLVLEGVTLTIEPSVVVKFECSYGLAVYGQLIARGTESEPIVFISAWGNWAGISFMDTSTDASYNEEGNYLSGSIMQYCTINYTWEGDQDVSVLQIEKSSPFIDHSNIIMPPARELPLSVTPSRRGIVVHKGSPRITNSRITNGGISVYNSVKGLHEPIETEVTIQGNIIENNKQSYGAGIDIWDSIVVIKGNVITNNRAYHPHGPGGGIWIQGVGKAIITENIISGNSAEKGGGICISSDNVTLSGNIITSNTAIYGGGICVRSASPMIYGNIISDNLGSGVFIWGGNPTLKYNNITDNDSGYGGIYIWRGKALINYNNIYGNTWYDVVNHDAQNPSDIDATNNWWGTTEESIIQTHIYDWYDDKSLGLVIFKPYLTSLFIEWTFAIITDLHIGRGYSDYGGVGWNDLGTGGQNYYLTDRLNRTVNWIIENRENHHIRFVIVLGDIADSAEYSEFDKAKVILSRLDDPDGDPNTNDAIPYVPVIGNHDVWPYTEDEEADWPEADRYFRKIFIEERLGLLSSYFENWESPDITEEITWGFPFKRWTPTCKIMRLNTEV